MNTLFPMFVNLQGKTCTVVGGGTIALRKILSLLECQASVRVIAPTFVKHILQLHDDKKIDLRERTYQKHDIVNSFLVFAATDNTEVNKQIYQDCTELHILCNVVDHPDLCHFYSSSVYTCGDLKIAISTNGISPALARKIKAELADMYPDAFMPYLKYLQKMREAIKDKIPDQSKRKKILEKIVADSEFLHRFSDEHFCQEIEHLDVYEELDKWCEVMGQNYLRTMKSFMTKLTVGSRGSNLALKQTQTVIDLLKTMYPSLNIELKIIKTKGDHIQDTPLAKIGGKGLFTKELERSLLAKEIDFAVHSLKDLPVELPSGLAILAYIKRERANDVLISKDGKPLGEIRRNGIIATGSLRRKFQLLQYRRDLQIVDVRGNIETRIKKLYKNNWDGLISAYAALERLGKTDLISEIISEDVMYPAIGQGIIAVESRQESEMHEILSAINDQETATCAAAERAFLQGLGGGCQVPVGVVSKVQGEQLHLAGVYLPEDGKYCIKENLVFDAGQPVVAGEKLAEKILKRYNKSR